MRASRQLREGLRERLANLEAIYEVLEEEVEETALDVAVTLRDLPQRRRAGSAGCAGCSAAGGDVDRRRALAALAPGRAVAALPSRAPLHAWTPGHPHLPRRGGPGQPGRAPAAVARPAPRLPLRLSLRQHRRRQLHRQEVRSGRPALPFLACRPGDLRPGPDRRAARLRPRLPVAPRRRCRRPQLLRSAPAGAHQQHAPASGIRTGRAASRPRWATASPGRRRK